MKTTADLETRLRNELKQWFVKQCGNVHADYYLYYLPTTPEHDGEILIAENAPDGYQLAQPERINKGATLEQNFNTLRNGILRRLPVLALA